MGRELSHVEAAELLGAYALDALDVDEAEAVERHARECGACRTEISEHREVIALLAPAQEPAPAGLWSRIGEALEEPPPPLAMPPAPPVAPVVPLEPSRRRSRLVQAGVAVAAAAAVAVIAVLGLRVADDGRRLDQMKEQARGTEFDRTVRAALTDPSARRLVLQRADGAGGVGAVVLPDGTGYLVNARLPELPADRTYQLWALVGPSRISVGVLGPRVGSAGFRAPADMAGLALTVEPAGGVVTTRNQPVAVGTF